MGIGIDLGGTTVKGAVVNDQGEILNHRSFKTDGLRGYPKVLNDIKELIKELLALSPGEERVGIGIPGILSGDGNTIVSCPNLNWQNIPLKHDLESELALEVLLVNDATAASIAEAAFGSTQGHKNSVLITLGTGVGGGVILNNRIISGAHGVASEIGHLLMEKNFYSCSCGKNGCLETFASATAIIKYCQMQLEQGRKSTLRTVAGFDGKAIVNAAKAGDPLAEEAVQRLAKYLGWAIANICGIIDPSIIAIGGGLSYAGEFLLEIIKIETIKRLTYPDIATPEIVLASFRNEAGMIGCANLQHYL